MHSSGTNWDEFFVYTNGQLFWKKSIWSRAKEGRVAGGVYKKTGYFYINVNGKRYSRHRVIWEMHFGKIVEGLFIDHINRIPGDDRIENLRLASNRHNLYNTGTPKNNTTGFRGVCRWPNGCYRATIMINKKSKYLGTFIPPEDAAQAYNFWAAKVAGEFACFNLAAEPITWL
jgi:hypothetical protein